MMNATHARRILPKALALFAALSTGCSIFVDLDELGGNGGAGGGTGTASVTAAVGTGGSTGMGGGIYSFTDDEWAGEFGDGTHNGTTWDDSESVVQLMPGNSQGELLSRVFDAQQAVSWETLEWDSLAPYQKALPGMGAAETGYNHDAMDMTGNVLLWHLDGTSSLGAGKKIADDSGKGHDAVVVTTNDPLSFSTGRFGQAIDDANDTYVYTTVTPGSDLDFGVSDFSWSIWAKSSEGCTGNKVYLGVEDAGTTKTHLWLGCADPSSSYCPNGASGGRAGGYFVSQQGSGDGGGFCGTSQLNDDNWHHLVLVKKGHPQATVTLYVDGVVEDQKSLSFISPLDFTASPELTVGAFSNGTYQAVGKFDEVAIFRRALSVDEVGVLYKRGALRLKFQVRACDDATCSMNPSFMGPNGDPLAYFLDPGGVLDPWTEHPLTGLPKSRYAQYRAVFESDILPATPQIWAVTITASP